MTNEELSNFKSEANTLLDSYQAYIKELLAYVACVKKVEIENADIKDDLDTITNEIELQLNDLYDEINITL